MSMSSTPNKVEDAIWKAAAILPLHAPWERVLDILLAQDVDVQARSEDAWMDMFNRFRKWVEDIRLSIDASPPSLPEDPENMPAAIVTLVDKSEWHPDGIARVWCRQSDKYEEDGMRDIIAEKLACPLDSMGRAVLTFAPNCGGRSLTRRFKIRSDGDFDIMFRKDPWKEEARQAEQGARDGDHPDPEHDSYSDEDQPQRRTVLDDEIEIAQKIAAEAIGTSLSKFDLPNLSPDQQLNFGGMFGRFSLSAARAIKAEIVPSLANPVQDRGRRMQPGSPREVPTLVMCHDGRCGSSIASRNNCSGM